MAKNIELKASVKNIEYIETKVSQVANKKNPISLNQIDTFFNFPYGRLKLRNINEKQYELIFYLRTNTADIKQSKYIRFTPFFPNLTKTVLTNVLGIKGEITKNRRLYFIENTRIHIDRVKNLGNFIEFEYVVDELHTSETGFNKVNFLLNMLNIDKTRICAESYMELIIKKNTIIH